MNKYLTGYKNTNYMIFDYLDYRSLFNLLATNKSYSFNEDYFRHRISLFYGKLAAEYKPKDITFCQQYKDIIGYLYSASYYCKRADFVLVLEYIYSIKPFIGNFNILAEYNSLDNIKFLIKHFKIDIQQCLKINQTILDCAMYGSQLETCQYLVSNYNMANHFVNQNVIDVCASRNNLEILKWVYKEFGKFPTYHRYIIRNISVIEWLIKIGKFNVPNNYVYNVKEYEACKFLYEKGYIPMSQDLVNIFFANDIFYAIKICKNIYNPTVGAFYGALSLDNVESMTFLCKLL